MYNELELQHNSIFFTSKHYNKSIAVWGPSRWGPRLLPTLPNGEVRPW